jgi:hypothetical protein
MITGAFKFETKDIATVMCEIINMIKLMSELCPWTKKRGDK